LATRIEGRTRLDDRGGGRAGRCLRKLDVATGAERRSERWRGLRDLRLATTDVGRASRKRGKAWSDRICSPVINGRNPVNATAGSGADEGGRRRCGRERGDQKKKWRPPPGGRAGVANRSGSGGVEPVPFQKKAFNSNQSMARGLRYQPVRSYSGLGRYTLMLPDPLQFRRGVISTFH
jgi:hypothetical protein